MIEREDLDWGARLTARPLQKHPDMQMQVDVHHPPKNQRTEVYVNFQGGVHMRRGDVRIWMNAMAAILSEADEVAEEFAPPKRAGRRKKS